ncbi:MAG: FadR/GntR family transcriptional regulator [Pseudomonadota bacterium]
MNAPAKPVADALFEPIDSDPLAKKVAEQIEILVLDGLLKENTKLPGERELAEQLDVSRPKLREGLKLLEQRGLVRIVAGEGAFVATLSGPAMSPALIALYNRHPEALDDHLEYRRHQEAFAARLAAERSTADDHARLSAIVATMQTAHDRGDAARAPELDSDFHLAVVEASYNRTLIHTMTALYELNRSAVFFSRTELLTSADVSATLLEQHRGIAEAIVAGDADRAERVSAEHIDYVRGATLQAFAQRDRAKLSKKRRLAGTARP